jgi:hypothetical protein
MKLRHGITRSVLLVGRLAIKVPTMRHGWQSFIKGMLANDQEAFWWSETRNPLLCPVLWSAPLGLVTVQRRVDRVATEDDPIDLDAFQHLPQDNKPCNFGFLGERMVKIDYGS